MSRTDKTMKSTRKHVHEEEHLNTNEITIRNTTTKHGRRQSWVSAQIRNNHRGERQRAKVSLDRIVKGEAGLDIEVSSRGKLESLRNIARFSRRADELIAA